MKAITLNFKTGEIKLDEVPPPVLKDGGILVKTVSSLISAGTEKAVISMANKGPIGKALDRPDLAKQVINKARTDGLLSTYKVVRNLISAPLPLGYSCAGIVDSVGKKGGSFQPGNRVACAGLNYANHAEVVYIPKNLAVPIPEGVDFESAAFVTLGAVAMQGVRQAHLELGERIVVIGVGLVGQIAVQLATAAGCKVFAVDLDDKKIKLARELGASDGAIAGSDDILRRIDGFTEGYGADAVIICAASKKSNETVQLAAEISRDKGRVVAVGDINLNLPRRAYYEKELDLHLSRSYGPGRYDPEYEEHGHDYPFGYVRWTENRNMKSFLNLVANGKINLKPLITHRFPIDEAEAAYQLVTGGKKEPFIGILLEYEHEKEISRKITIREDTSSQKIDQVSVGIIGAGKFAQGILIPAIKDVKGVEIRAISTGSGLTSKAVAKKYNAEFCTSNNDEIIQHPDINAVVIITRHNLHADFVIRALKAGKHVYVEKPLAITPEELDSIKNTVSEIQQKDEPLPVIMVGYNRRFSPLGIKLKSFYEKRTEPMVINYRINAGYIDPNDESSWVHDVSVGGGRIVGEVCHFVDFMQFLTDSFPVKVFASGFMKTNVASTDTLNIHLKFQGGSIGCISYLANGDKAFPKERIEVFCNHSIAVLENFKWLTYTVNNKTQKYRKWSQDKGHSNEIKRFFEAIQQGKESPISFDSLVATSKTTFTIIDVLTEGCLKEIQ